MNKRPMTELPEIRVSPDPILKQKAEEVTPNEAYDIAVELIKAMLHYQKGVQGLAAPQIGIPKRAISYFDELKIPKIMINPKIIRHKDTARGFESCASVPGFSKNILRANRVMIAYRDLDNKLQQAEFHGLLSRVIQHEIDHLDGILITDYPLKGSAEEERLQKEYGGE